jgi:hypothetical protein
VRVAKLKPRSTGLEISALLYQKDAIAGAEMVEHVPGRSLGLGILGFAKLRFLVANFLEDGDDCFSAGDFFDEGFACGLG